MSLFKNRDKWQRETNLWLWKQRP